jgi:hypothetical protein
MGSVLGGHEWPLAALFARDPSEDSELIDYRDYHSGHAMNDLWHQEQRVKAAPLNVKPAPAEVAGA